ncbi:hypothetical protein [Vibrio maerlii]|uniref:hypothetical protein n=1 Tax=Vibrio maerlii TaxID=2231648 RepID=UPI0013E024B5|nr:hypothetical protein [Vibrio maerlii]
MNNLTVNHQPRSIFSSCKVSLSVIFIAMLVGCAKTSVVEYDSDSHVDVLYSEPQESPYKELGLITVTTGQTIFHDKSSSSIVLKLQNKAAELGADAIVVRSVIEGSWGFKGGGETGFHKGTGEALAIEFIE